MRLVHAVMAVAVVRVIVVTRRGDRLAVAVVVQRLMVGFLAVRIVRGVRISPLFIGLIGLVSDFAFKWVNRRLFPWAQLGR